jgi:hypothetical protein
MKIIDLSFNFFVFFYALFYKRVDFDAFTIFLDRSLALDLFSIQVSQALIDGLGFV